MFNFFVHVMCSTLVGIISPVSFNVYACNVAQNYPVELKGKKNLSMYENQVFHGLMLVFYVQLTFLCLSFLMLAF